MLPSILPGATASLVIFLTFGLVNYPFRPIQIKANEDNPSTITITFQNPTKLEQIKPILNQFNTSDITANIITNINTAQNPILIQTPYSQNNQISNL